MKLQPLLYPRAIAVVGASRTPGKVGHEILANPIRGGFRGKFFPVNPSADEVCGLSCYQDIGGLAETIDLSVIAVPVPAVLAAVNRSLQARAKAIAKRNGVADFTAQVLAETRACRLCSIKAVVR